MSEFDFTKLSTLFTGNFLMKLDSNKRIESTLEVQRVKQKFPDNLGHNILELDNVLVEVRFAKSKMKLEIQDSKLIIQVAERLKTQDLRKQKTLGNSQI